MLDLRNSHHTGTETAGVRWSGVASFKTKADMKKFLRRRFPIIGPLVNIKGWRIKPNWADLTVTLKPKPNLVVQTGVGRSGDRLFNISGGTTPTVLNALTQEVSRIGVDNGTTNPTATSSSSDAGGGTDTGSSSQTIRTISPTATRASLGISASGTFNDPTTGGIGAVGFVMKRLFLTAHNANITNTTSADPANTLYSMTNVFTVDFTTIPTWTAVFTAQVTLAGS